jgi:ornithine--oxo-acid transaminase
MTSTLPPSLEHRITPDQHIELAEKYAAHNYHPLPVVVAEADGAWVTDVSGRRYLDCLAGYSALNFGHRHPQIIAAARDQLDRLGRSTTTSSARSSPSCPTSWRNWPPEMDRASRRRWCCR